MKHHSQSFRSSQWAVDQKELRALPPHRYVIRMSALGEIEDWGAGPIYTIPVHLAEKEWVDIDDLLHVFRYAWSVYGALQAKPFQVSVMENTERVARRIAERGY